MRRDKRIRVSSDAAAAVNSISLYLRKFVWMNEVPSRFLDIVKLGVPPYVSILIHARLADRCALPASTACSL